MVSGAPAPLTAHGRLGRAGQADHAGDAVGGQLVERDDGAPRGGGDPTGQPEPILCQTTGPPSPVSSCSRPSAVSAFSSPTFHLALFTNW